MEKITHVDAILAINPDAKFKGTKENIEWLDGTSPISDEDIQTKLDELDYINKRKYPTIEDQLDMQYWDKVNGTSTWQTAIAKVKSDNPKE